MNVDKLVAIGMGISVSTYFKVFLLYLSGNNKNIGSVAMFGMN